MTSVLFVSHTAENGGAELFLKDMLTGGPDGWRGAFLADGPVAKDLERSGRLAGVVAAGDGLHKIRRAGGASFSAVLALWRAAVSLARVARGYEVLCANSQKALFVCALASVLARRPLVWILHDIITDPAFSPLNRKAAVTAANLFARRIVANSQATADAFRECGGKDAVDLVYNGFDVARWPVRSVEAALAVRRAFDLDDRPIAALFGRLTAWKGQTVFLQALADAPEAQGLVVGGPLFGEEAYEAELKQLSIALGLNDRVRFAGFRNDVGTLMAGSDILVHASTHAEPFGRVIVEGQLTGLPVIAAHAGGVTDIVAEGLTGLLTSPGDAGELADAIRALAADPELAGRLGEAGRASATKRFNLDQSRTDLSRVFGKVTP